MALWINKVDGENITGGRVGIGRPRMVYVPQLIKDVDMMRIVTRK